MMRIRVYPSLLLVALWIADAAAIEMHSVPVPIKSNRLLGMSCDDEGGIWCGSFLKAIHRYDPRTGQIDTIELPSRSTAVSCHCVGKKVYILGQKYPRLVIYDRAARTFREIEYPTDTPDIWYGTQADDERYLYLFDRGSVAIIKWDTQTDTGRVIPYPFQPRMMTAGRYVAADQALWCWVMEPDKWQYKQLGVTRFDLKTDTFTDYVPLPEENAQLEPHTDPEATAFFPLTLKGKLAPLDLKTRQWRKQIAVPEYGKRFAFMGQGAMHDGRYYFSISTYNGTEVGCDGKPFHFCNGLLEFDPKRGEFAFRELVAQDAYYQISYSVSAGGEFYATGTNIRQPDGTLNSKQIGEIMVWTTRKPDQRSAAAGPPPQAVTPFNGDQARAHQEAWGRHLGTAVERTNSIGVKLAVIPPGEFLMGSSPEQSDLALTIIRGTNKKPNSWELARLKDESPQHRVTISRPFRLGTTEVTIGQFRKFVEATKYVTEAERYGFGSSAQIVSDDKVKPEDKQKSWQAPGYAVTEDSPVSQVTWNDAVEFCNWLSTREKLHPCYHPDATVGWKLITETGDANADPHLPFGYRLPTEAEWEYACRAGTTTEFAFGDDAVRLEQYGWFGANSGGGAHAVGEKLPNAFGLYDMHGNLWEWCHDWFAADGYAASSLMDPTGPTAGTHRSARGGDCYSSPASSRSACRSYIAQSYRNSGDGIRLVRITP